MFETGEVVVYEGAGVCVIEEIRSEKFNKESRLYYVLKPVKEKSTTIYFPVDGDRSKLCDVLSEKEVKELLDSDYTVLEWIPDDLARKECFDEILKGKDRFRMLSMLYLMQKVKNEKAQNGKRLRAADEKAFNEVKALILGEISYVINVSEEELLDSIIRKTEATV